MQIKGMCPMTDSDGEIKAIVGKVFPIYLRIWNVAKDIVGDGWAKAEDFSTTPDDVALALALRRKNCIEENMFVSACFKSIKGS
jgi:hypothetical protein